MATDVIHLGRFCISCTSVYFGAEVPENGRGDLIWFFLHLYELETNGYTGDTSAKTYLFHLSSSINLRISFLFYL